MANRSQRRQHAGIGDKPVKALPAAGDRRGQPGNRRKIRHVELNDGCGAACRADLVINLFQRANGTPGDDQLCAGTRGGHSHGPSDAAGGASDKDKTPRQVVRGVGHRLPLPCETRLALSPEASWIG